MSVRINLTAYEAQPGTVPHRVIAFLSSQPTGQWVSTAALNDAIGQDAGYPLSAALVRARCAGQVRARRVPGHQHFEWAVGDGVPSPLAEDCEAEESLADLRLCAPTPATAASAAHPHESGRIDRDAGDEVVASFQRCGISMVASTATVSIAADGEGVVTISHFQARVLCAALAGLLPILGVALS